jgi:hypothetical protein
MHASTEDKVDDIKDSFYEELEQVFDQFPRYHMKILLGDLNAKVGREGALKQVRHRWQQMTQPLHTSQLLKPGKHKYRIQTKAHAHPHAP